MHTDPLGSVVMVTDASRNVVERTQYAPYGQVLNRPEHDGPGYTGHEEDAATGLTNMQARYDNKAIGRMLSMDPVDVDSTTGGNFNRYAYANDNPYRFTDPDGRFSCSNGNATVACGDAIKQFYNSAVKSLGNMKQGSSDYKATDAALKYLGAPDKANGATVKALSGNERGDAAKGGNISIDVSKIKNFGAALKATGRDSDKTTAEVQNGVGAGVLIHEATHENDYLSPGIGYPHSEAADRALEVHAYSVEKAVGGALGLGDTGLSTQHEFDSAVQNSVNTFCSTPGNGC